MRNREQPVSGRETVVQRVVEAVAAYRGVDTRDLDEVMYDAVDTDALETVFARGVSGVCVEFVFDGCHVTVEDGRVSVGNANRFPDAATD